MDVSPLRFPRHQGLVETGGGGRIWDASSSSGNRKEMFMRSASIARLSLAMFVLAFSLMATPGHALDACPYESCSEYMALCQESGGTATYSHLPGWSGWCQDESMAFRERGVVHCTTRESVVCAWW